MIKKTITALTLGMLMQLGVSCQKPIPAQLSSDNLIPLPVQIQADGSSYLINEKTIIYIDDTELTEVANLLSQQIKGRTGITPKVMTTEQAPSKGIYLSASGIETKGEEAYQIKIGEKAIQILANHPAGIFRASQTIEQLISKHVAETVSWIIPSGAISDYPQFEYRGMMLDVSRHFFGVKDVKRVIDLAASYKINVLHMHLSDDQGWRIEIKSWPKLTSVGGQTQVGGGKGGFYTQEQFKDIVAYAKQRYITIVPEIDMPGHTNAAVVAYPELNGTKKKAELYTGTKVGFSTLATRKEVTYQFVDDVVRELAAITDGPYIHIGGDESHVTKLDDYIYFINRTKEIVKKYNKTMIGWDEIAHADIDETDIVQYWSRETKNVKMGVNKGAKVLLSPNKHTYLDMKYNKDSRIGLDWAGLVEVDQAYNWNPETLVEGVGKENILGIESPLWTETVETMDDIEYLVFPRLLGHAELGWSPVEKQNWESYKVRLVKHGKRLEELGVDFYKSKLIPWDSE
ncbi:beta-N-acetylhexosaminidase [Carboxylicivirga marina]|uniref:beta-N-acetylhexosaminidase n=1 Tax=Carboxylicivirga marina TaxID=2800988 RepID=A0ABS1HL86_9BACT|nr:beta-N-acetylhexosaminidase [Carboxylicivirga marina]MBK3518448.1 beta-N-acetylhexosaminidase [Carboxylicivirga marina]